VHARPDGKPKDLRYVRPRDRGAGAV